MRIKPNNRIPEKFIMLSIKKVIGIIIILFLLSNTYVVAQKYFCLSEIKKTRSKVIDSIPRGTFDKQQLWENGKTLRVRFLNGTDLYKENFKKYALEWTRYANLKLEFVASGPAEIRVKYAASNKGSWSYIGTGALTIAEQDDPTIMIGCDTTWSDDFSMKELRRHVMHEFGHAIGLEHEHLSPVGGIKWDSAAVYRYYINNNGWDSSTVYNAVFKTLDETHTNGEFDLASIMLYTFPNNLVGLPDTVAQYLGYNTILSEGDKKTIASLYPSKIPVSDGKPPSSDGICSAISSTTVNNNLKVYPSFQVNNALGEKLEVLIFYYNSDGSPIINPGGMHMTETNQLVGYQEFTPSYEYCIYNRAQLLFGINTPLADLLLKPGETKSISYKVALRFNGVEFVKSGMFYRDISYEQ